MLDTTYVRKGVVIRHNGDFFVVTEAKFVSPGKGSAFVRVKMRSLTIGKNIEQTYKSGEAVDVVEVENRRIQFLYKNGHKYSFMDNESYETIELGEDIVGDSGKYLLEGMEVRSVVFNEIVVSIEIPVKVKYKVTEAPPAVKGDTTSSGRLMKDIVLENGLTVRAPIFIRPGDVILINTDDGEYCERVNE
ncbi:MAG: elongation factor P [Patescibacteria group bacterium]